MKKNKVRQKNYKTNLVKTGGEGNMKSDEKNVFRKLSIFLLLKS